MDVRLRTFSESQPLKHVVLSALGGRQYAGFRKQVSGLHCNSALRGVVERRHWDKLVARYKLMRRSTFAFASACPASRLFLCAGAVVLALSLAGCGGFTSTYQRGYVFDEAS